MTLSNQGFETALNLSESINDRQVLNNLGGGNIQQDIALFRNNKRNTSLLVWQNNINGSSITNDTFIFPDDTEFIFTTSDEVQVIGNSLGNLDPNVKYYIVSYSIKLGSGANQLGFGLSLQKGGDRVSIGTIQDNITFKRTDELTKESILNIALPLSFESPTGVSSNITPSFTRSLDRIESNIDLANLIRRGKYSKNSSLISDKRILIEGTVNTADPGDFNTSAANMSSEKSPGLFIISPLSSLSNIIRNRAYQSSEQPWESDVATASIKTLSSQVNIGDLQFEDGIEIESFDGLGSTFGDINSTTTGFTHKIPIIVDGVQYFLLLRQI